MTHRHFTQPPTDVARARLTVLLEAINQLYQSGTMVLEEDLLSAYSEALATFFKSLDGSITGVISNILEGTPPDPLHYNIFTNAINRDLTALFLELGAVDKLVVSSFNSIAAEHEQIVQTSRRISNKLGDYLLYADPSLGGGYFFGDSFSSAERIDLGSSLVEGDECYLSQEEGVILLPLDGEPERPKIDSYLVNDPSNGVFGSHAQIDVRGHDAIEALGDNVPDTWFEYEKVTTTELIDPLVLDLTIVLEDFAIVNHIHINPINFGTPTPVEILKLETSYDGVEYQSIKDEVPLSDFISEEEEDVFVLSSATSKYAGQGFYSFLPRRMKYIHIVLQQHTPYTINTLNGSRLRYAIGIRDVNILGRRHQALGSIVSTLFSTSKEIKKLALWASENPAETSVLADLAHSVSYNDGAVWYPIQPQGRAGFEIPEILNFNTVALDSIETDSDVQTLRHKITIQRNPENFKGNVTLKEEKATHIDVVSAPAAGPFELQLTREPIDDTVRVLMPFWGSFSCPRARSGSGIAGDSPTMDLDFVEFTVDAPARDTIRFPLPYAGFKNLREKLRVFHNGAQIEFCSSNPPSWSSTDTSYTTVDADSKVYFLNRGGNELQFGHMLSGESDITNRKGFIPDSGSKIKVCLDGDSPRLVLTDQGYVLMLSTSSDGIKDNVSLVSFSSLDQSEAEEQRMPLPSGRRRSRVRMRSRAQFVRSGGVGNSSGHRYTKRVGKTSRSRQSRMISPLQSTGSSVNYDVTEGSDSDEGQLPPIYLTGLNNFWIEEYNNDNELITDISEKQYTSKVEFVDGDTELRSPSTWQLNETTFSFDPYSGTVHLGSRPLADRTVVLVCKVMPADVIPPDNWEYNRNSVTGRIHTDEILLAPEAVFTAQRKISAPVNVKSVELVADSDRGHSWFKQKVVQGTVVFDPSMLGNSVEPVEVPYVDGASELTSIVEIADEIIEEQSGVAGEYSFYLNKPDATHIMSGAPSFRVIRSVDSVVALSSQFVTQLGPSDTLTSEGDWKVTKVGDNIQITVKCGTGGLREHRVSYYYESTDIGVDVNGLYSIDYDNGVMYFATNLFSTGNITFEVTTYSAFYNIAKVVEDGDISEIDVEGKKVILSDVIGMQFLKQDTVKRARPQFLKVLYEFYKKSSESLKDLEPYFSPICKDIAFRAVTSDILEEL
jgi:hypothetical protein